MAQANVKYRDENGAAQTETRSFDTGPEAQAYAAGVVKDGFGTAGAPGQAQKFYPAGAVSVVEVSG